MDADLELLPTVVYCMTDDFLPERAANARRRITDAELITLCVAQAIMGIPSGARFLAVASRRLGHLFPRLPERTAYHKRRLRLSALIAHFARHSPGFFDDVLLVDSTPVECARSARDRQARRRLQPRQRARQLRRLRLLRQPQPPLLGLQAARPVRARRHPRALALTSPKVDEKLVCLQLVARCERQPGQMLMLIGDKNFRGKDFETELAKLDATIQRPRRKAQAFSACRSPG